jgi:hypothetical protein
MKSDPPISIKNYRHDLFPRTGWLDKWIDGLVKPNNPFIHQSTNPVAPVHPWLKIRAE